MPKLKRTLVVGVPSPVGAIGVPVSTVSTIPGLGRGAVRVISLKQEAGSRSTSGGGWDPGARLGSLGPRVQLPQYDRGVPGQVNERCVACTAPQRSDARSAKQTQPWPC